MDELQINKLQENLKYNFKDPSLLIKALTHSSYANEKAKNSNGSNERLEFLGDSLLGMIIALLIHNNKPELSEGKMTKLRAKLVCEQSLTAFARELDIGTYLLLGRGEENGGGRSRPSILSDALEAVLAAVYLDGGMEPAERLISGYFMPQIEAPTPGLSDNKTRLQELVHCKPGQTLVYELTGEHGPDHDKLFTVEVKLNGKSIGTGSGKTKKAAEQEAASTAINVLNDM